MSWARSRISHDVASAPQQIVRTSASSSQVTTLLPARSRRKLRIATSNTSRLARCAGSRRRSGPKGGMACRFSRPASMRDRPVEGLDWTSSASPSPTLTDCSIHDRAATSPVLARQLLPDRGGHEGVLGSMRVPPQTRVLDPPVAAYVLIANPASIGGARREAERERPRTRAKRAGGYSGQRPALTEKQVGSYGDRWRSQARSFPWDSSTAPRPRIRPFASGSSHGPTAAAE
jgi:hypothetical protein